MTAVMLLILGETGFFNIIRVRTNDMAASIGKLVMEK